jgi:hypothetical protein
VHLRVENLAGADTVEFLPCRIATIDPGSIIISYYGLNRFSDNRS